MRLNKGELSPIILHWFNVEPAQEDDFDENNRFLMGEGQVGPRERQPQIMLKRLQKEVDRECALTRVE